ncbi:MAG: hypothetical protein ACTSRP_05265, partial [Candidatus Helarchaeota archaeon]
MSEQERYNEYCLVDSILRYLVELEERIPYPIDSIPILESPDVPKDYAMQYLRAIERISFYGDVEFDVWMPQEMIDWIRTCAPPILLDGDKSFIVVDAKAYNLLNDLHKILIYFAVNKRRLVFPDPIEIPDRLRSKNFNKYLDTYFQEIEPGKYILTDVGIDVKWEIQRVLEHAVFFKRDPVEEVKNFYRTWKGDPFNLVEPEWSEGESLARPEPIQVYLAEKERKREILDFLTRIHNFNDFNNVGNFKKAAYIYGFSSEEELDNYILRNYFGNDPEKYTNWKDKVLDIRKYLRFFYNFYSSENTFKERFIRIYSKFLLSVYTLFHDNEHSVSEIDTNLLPPLALRILRFVPVSSNRDKKIAEYIDNLNNKKSIRQDFFENHVIPLIRRFFNNSGALNEIIRQVLEIFNNIEIQYDIKSCDFNFKLGGDIFDFEAERLCPLSFLSVLAANEFRIIRMNPLLA